MNCKIKAVSSNRIQMQLFPPYTIFPLGDSALTIDFGNAIDTEINRRVLYLFHQFCRKPLTAMKEAVPAYSSLTVYYDFALAARNMQPGQNPFDLMRQQAEERMTKGFEADNMEQRIVSVPVCYEEEFAPDIHTLAENNNISIDRLIQVHTASAYKVFMLGFLPGFAYMGETDELISHPRKLQPVNVRAGSVGIAGRQTGIYPFDSPGGWQIIGRTPLKLFDASATPELTGSKNESGYQASLCLLLPGDTVQFYSITKNEFENIKSRHT
jgi:inhibitor of KinA